MWSAVASFSISASWFRSGPRSRSKGAPCRISPPLFTFLAGCEFYEEFSTFFVFRRFPSPPPNLATKHLFDPPCQFHFFFFFADFGAELPLLEIPRPLLFPRFLQVFLRAPASSNAPPSSSFFFDDVSHLGSRPTLFREKRPRILL